METQDRTIKCATCGREFLFTAKEQEFFQNKGFKEPRHCRECRQQRKQEREQAIAQAAGHAYVPGRETFKVVCANCQRETFVPFRPITGKPVLCKDCFIAQRFGAQPPPSAQEPPQAAPPEVPMPLAAQPQEVPAIPDAVQPESQDQPDQQASGFTTGKSKHSADLVSEGREDYSLAAKTRED